MGFDDGEQGSSSGRGHSSIAPSPYGAASARPSAASFGERRDPIPDEETSEPPGARQPTLVDPEELPSFGDDDDPLARTNPWELEAVAVPDPSATDDGGSSPGPSAAGSSKRGSRKRR